MKLFLLKAILKIGLFLADWSDTMAELALKWAKQCRFDHDTFNARIIRGYSGVGQNVLGANFQPSWNLTIKNWHSEIADYHYGTETDAMVGHYTQEIYWDAKLIGCGGAYCPNSHLKYIYVCDYYTGQDSTLFPYTLANATHQLTTCPRPANSTLCDCNGKSCQYGGMLDINTCQCTCYQLATGDECAELTCKPDYTFCEHYKDTFCDVKYMYSFARYCPNMCNSCAK